MLERKAVRAAVIAWLSVCAFSTLTSQAPAPVVSTLGELRGEKADGALMSPNGKLIAYEIGSKEIRVLDIAKHSSTVVASGDINLLSWSPASDALAFIRDRDANYEGYIWMISVDPSTGVAKGPAQRVTTTKVEDSGSFTAEGKSIVSFESSTQQLFEVPATGGRERVIAKLGYHADVAGWSRDGKSLFVIAAAPVPAGMGHWSLQQLNVTGGAATTVRNITEGCFISGLSEMGYLLASQCEREAPDSRISTVYDMKGRAVTHFALPRGTAPASWGPGGSLLGIRVDSRTTLGIVAVTGATVREVPGASAGVRFPVWSPDGRQVAFQAEANGRSIVEVLNADGSGRRQYGVPNGIADWVAVVWSPDGKRLAYESAGLAAVNVLDLSTGESRTLVAGEESITITHIRWNEDGQAIRYARVRAGDPKTRQNDLHEVTLDGADRKIQDIAAFFRPLVVNGRWPVARGGFLPDGSIVSTTFADTMYVNPANGGPVRKFALEGKDRSAWGASADGSLLASGYARDGRNYTSIELTSTRDGSRRVVSVPFEVERRVDARPVFLPDGKHLLVQSLASGGNPQRLWLISTDGEAPRMLANLSDGSQPAYVDLSPDGRSVVFARQGPPTTTFLKLDLTALLPR